ncbi:MAG: c-type cytochrome [Methylomonas sp.]|nr:c-type cytochrome [Methylomonas sp.]
MSSIFYDLLAGLGFTHPFHPVLVHVPAGMSIGAVCFAFLALATGNRVYRVTAYQATVLAFIFALLAIPVGILDWQRFYGGAGIFEIRMKLVLASLYVFLLVTALGWGRWHLDSMAMPTLYVLSLFTVMGLGFFGGELVYRGFSPDAPEQYDTGRRIFESNCSGCHRRGENVIVSTMPLRNAPQLSDFNDFVTYIREPRMPDGSPGIMPRFTLEKLSDKEARQLYDYLYFAFLTPNRPLH